MPLKALEEYLKISQTAAIFNIKDKTVRTWIAQERLGCVHFGRAVRVPMSEVLRLIEAGSSPAKLK